MTDYRIVDALPLSQPPPTRPRGPRWLVVAGLALAFALALGVGAFVGSALGTRGASAAAGGPSASQVFGQPFASDSRAPGASGARSQCAPLTVSSISGQTIVAKAADGTSVTIHATSSTQYTRNGQAATASAVTTGARVRVSGTHNSDGSITATHIDIGG